MISFHPIIYLIAFFGTINLLRMTMFLVGSDLYRLRQHLKNKRAKQTVLPTISVLIPAFNEEGVVCRAIDSIADNDYPEDLLQIIVVDDGSRDKTWQILTDLKASGKVKNLTIVHQENGGKASALNNGLKNFATGELVMCLDADSYLSPDALKKAAAHFADPSLVALAANIKIIDSGSLLSLIQKFEYIVCYQMKRAQTVLNMEYIIGGIGSTFRHSFLQQVNYYDTNTVTEDIDLTMKMLRQGNRQHRVAYGSDVTAYTESVISIPDLIKQRYRWKYGRCQAFLKNTSLFFNPDRKYSRSLTFFFLPYAVFGDFAFLLEPIMLGYITYVVLAYRDVVTFLSAFGVVSFYLLMNLLTEETISVKDKLRLLPFTPMMYFLFYVLSFVEYVALIKTLLNLKSLRKNLDSNVNSSWQPVARPDYSIS